MKNGTTMDPFKQLDSLEKVMKRLGTIQSRYTQGKLTETQAKKRRKRVTERHNKRVQGLK